MGPPLRFMLMRSPPTPTPMQWLMTTPRLTFRLLRPVMVLELPRDLTLLLFLMAVPKMLPTLLMVTTDMLLRSHIQEQLSTLMHQPLMPPLLLLLMLDKLLKRKRLSYL